MIDSKDDGFTLVELMVVVLIIAILIAIAIPTFLGAQRRSQEAQAKGNVRTGLVTEKAYYSDEEAYTQDSVILEDIEDGIRWGEVRAADNGVVIEHVAANGEGVVIKSLSASGTMFCIADAALDFDYAEYGITTAGTYYAKRENAGDASTCQGLVWDTTSAGWN